MLKILIIVALCSHFTGADKFFSKDAGYLHLTEQKWEIQHSLNLTEYMETTEVLKQCIDTLNNVCKDGINPLCSYFQRSTANINTEIMIDSSKLKKLSRPKRFLMTIPIILGISIVSLWAGMLLKSSAIKTIRDEIHGNLEIIQQAANISMSSFHLMEEITKANDRNLQEFHDAINNNTKNLNSQMRFFNAINVISFSTQSHEKMQIKLNDIYYGDLDSRLFEIIDFQEFSNTVEKINKLLEPDLSLPNIITMSRNKFIKTYTDYNSTHLTVSVDLPVIRKRGYRMFEFVPLPIEENGKVYILDMPTITYYKNDSKFLRFPENDTKNLLCKTQDGTTICNSFLEDYNANISNCMTNLLKPKSSDEGCVYKEIPKQNYFIRLTEGIVYLHLIYPIRVIVDCRGRVFAMTVTTSGKIYLATSCEIHKYSDYTHYGGEKQSTMKSLEHAETELNLFNTTDGYKKLSYLPVWDKYSHQFVEAKARFIRLQNATELQSEKIDEDSNSITSEIFDVFRTIAYIMVAVILVMVILWSCEILLTHWKR